MYNARWHEKSFVVMNYASVSQAMGRDPNVGRQDFIDGSLIQEGCCAVAYVVYF